MRKYAIIGMLLLGSVFSYATVTIMDMEKELVAVGISNQSIRDAKTLLDNALKKHKILLIELDQKELEINKLLIEDPEKNWDQINDLFDETGQINSDIKKNQLKTQINVRKYISKEAYQEAKALYIKDHQLEKHPVQSQNPQK